MSRCISFLLPLLVSTLAACSIDAGSTEAPESAEIQVTLDSAHPALSSLPQVQRVALGEDLRTTFVAGQLGFELDAIGAAFEMDGNSLTLLQSNRDFMGVTVERYSQERDGLAVIGGDLRIARFDDGSIHSASGLSWDPEQEILEATISATQALDTAISTTDGATAGSAGSKVYIAPSDGSSPVLAWHFVVEGRASDGMPIVDDVYVDAALGGVVARYPQVHSARVRQTYDAAGQEVQGTLVRSEATALTGDIDVDQAHDSAGITYDCLMQLFARDSYDGTGNNLVSIANFGTDFKNAFWNGELMAYGDGMGVPDIGTHEFIHAVTQLTGGMVYENEPGALNEAWSDILAAVCEANTKGGATAATWNLGEDSILGTLRYMDDPVRDNYSRDHYDTRITITGAPSQDNDQGGVHGNSGIANLAFYLLSQGGTHPRGTTTVDVKPIGINDAGQIFYRALTTYMNTNTQFIGARTATEQAAEDIYGAGSTEAISVSEAWQSVGVGGPAPERIEEEPTPDPTDPNNPDDGTGDGDPDDGTGDGGGGGGPQAGTGTVTGGCSTTGSQGSTGFSLLILLGCAAFFGRRREAE